MDREALIELLRAFYDLGVECAKKVNSPTGWSKTATVAEARAMNRALKVVGQKAITPEEYEGFNK